MIIKFNNYIQEGIDNYLHGPTEEELKNNFISGKITLFKYLDICRSNKIKLPTDDEILYYLKQLNPTDALFQCVSKHTGFLKGVEQAVKDGADLTKRDDSLDFTALEYAIANNYPKIVKYLMENNASFDKSAFDSLYIVTQMVKSGDLELVKFIIKKGEFCLDLVDAKKLMETSEELEFNDLMQFFHEYIYHVEEYIKKYIKTI